MAPPRGAFPARRLTGAAQRAFWISKSLRAVCAARPLARIGAGLMRVGVAAMAGTPPRGTALIPGAPKGAARARPGSKA